MFSSRRRRRAEQRSEDFRRLPYVADDDVEEDEFFTAGQPINTADEGKTSLLLSSRIQNVRRESRTRIPLRNWQLPYAQSR